MMFVELYSQLLFARSSNSYCLWNQRRNLPAKRCEKSRVTISNWQVALSRDLPARELIWLLSRSGYVKFSRVNLSVVTSGRKLLLLGPQIYGIKFYSLLGIRMKNELLICQGQNHELRVPSRCNSVLGEKFGQGSVRVETGYSGKDTRAEGHSQYTRPIEQSSEWRMSTCYPGRRKTFKLFVF